MSQLFSVSTSKLISTVLILLTDPGFQARMAGGRAVFLPQACPTLSFPPPHANFSFPISYTVIVRPSLPAPCLGRGFEEVKGPISICY